MDTIKLSFDLSRVWKHFKDKGFGIVSAYSSKLSKKENNDNQIKLKKEVREKGYGYKEIKDLYFAILSRVSKTALTFFIKRILPKLLFYNN